MKAARRAALQRKRLRSRKAAEASMRADHRAQETRRFQARAKHQEERKKAREAERRFEELLRTNKDTAFRWRERKSLGRYPCSCGYEGRTWIGGYTLYHGKYGEPPYDICATDPLCAVCAVAREITVRRLYHKKIKELEKRNGSS